MPGALHHRPAFLDVVDVGIPDHGLHRPADHGHVAVPVVHRFVPGHLGDRSAGDEEILSPQAVDVLVVVAAHDVVHHVRKVGGYTLQAGALRGQQGLGHVVHLVGHAVVDRALERLELDRLVPWLLPAVLHRAVLLRIVQQEYLPGTLHPLVVGLERVAPVVHPLVDQGEQLLVLLGQLLLVRKDLRVVRSVRHVNPPQRGRRAWAPAWAAQPQAAGGPCRSTSSHRRCGPLRPYPRPPVWSRCRAASARSG